MASALHCIAFFFLLLTFLAVAVAFSCPEWLLDQRILISRDSFYTKGLWLRCQRPSSDFRYGNCEWLFADNFRIQKDEPVWFLAVQILFSLALAISALAVIFGSCAAICGKRCRGFSVTCGFLNLTFLLLVAAVALFWAETYVKLQARPSGDGLVMGWSFWVAVGSTGTCLISTILYYFLSRRDYHTGY
ncbi:uncharacterized protein LOC135481392 [Liolophura sinensis]|uniref:uncharacterized protein LOC135481392 n=1 Tax=Liolophura sinensis TaxID=3198878 RepID=UPI0031594958